VSWPPAFGYAHSQAVNSSNGQIVKTAEIVQVVQIVENVKVVEIVKTFETAHRNKSPE
jgi:hypothetical protein